MAALFTNIKELFQTRELAPDLLRGSSMDEVPSIKNAFMIVRGGRITSYGKMSDVPETAGLDLMDCTDYIITPGYVDSHTHLVYAATREAEFEQRIKGLSYEQIAASGGGILNSARRLRAMSEDELYDQALVRLKLVLSTGTTCIEIKSGYGLDLESELKMLRVIQRLKKTSINGARMTIKSTFLGAHAIPPEFKNDRAAYIQLITDEILPAIATNQLADYIDVFCEKNYFTPQEMIHIMMAGAKHGLKPKVHVNQFNALGAVSDAVENGSVSVDHLEVMQTSDYQSLSSSNTIATALPSCSFFLGLDYAPVKQMIDKDIAVALASDFNPGSTPSGNMNFVYALACIKMGLTPDQALNALTINAAHALELAHQVGSITPGHRADLLFFKDVDNLARIPYSFGNNLISRVMLEGIFVNNIS
ncbi:MAG: imidazolonepropionase [Nonlabens sp.]